MGTLLDSTSRRRSMAFAAAALAAVFALGALGADADAKKKKRKKVKNPGTTISVPLGMTSGVTLNGTATCPAKTHATGGGFSVAPSFSPPTTGMRSLNSTSYPSGSQDWVTGSSSYATPSATGQLTSFARCERNNAGRIATRSSSSLTLAPGVGQNMTFNCPPTTHVISGGYAASSLGTFNFSITSHRIVVLQNRRTGVGQWTISAFNNPQSPSSTTLTGYAICERNAKGSAVSEAASPLTPVINDGRTTADATCGGKVHTVSGGFLVSHTFPGAAPLVSVDENQPVGKAGWHVGLWEYPTNLPPGTTLQAFSYCKKDQQPAARAKRRGSR